MATKHLKEPHTVGCTARIVHSRAPSPIWRATFARSFASTSSRRLPRSYRFRSSRIRRLLRGARGDGEARCGGCRGGFRSEVLQISQSALPKKASRAAGVLQGRGLQRVRVPRGDARRCQHEEPQEYSEDRRGRVGRWVPALVQRTREKAQSLQPQRSSRSLSACGCSRQVIGRTLCLLLTFHVPQGSD